MTAVDYLREVLERQEALLRRLLTGERDTERGATETACGAERVLQLPEGEGETRPSGGGEARGHRAAAAAAAETVTEHATDLRRDSVGATELLAVDGSETEALETQAADFQRYRHADALWRDAAPAVWLGAALPAEAAVDVEHISRAVQRDARRYDGGFTMY